MRKLKLQVQLSVDGFVAGPNGEMDWMTWNWDDKLKDFVTGLTASIDCILLGRKMTDGFIGYWKGVTVNPDDGQYPFAKIMYDTHKVVFSKTIKETEWENTVVATGDITKEVNNLKNQEGSDIIVYGGAGFVSSLIENNLIDEYNLFINPTAIGSGMAIFAGLQQKLGLKLAKSTAFECGIVVLTYSPA